MRLYLPDTNIFIYAYHGEEPYAKNVFNWITDKSLLISSIVAAEFLSGGDKDERKRFETLLDQINTVPIDTIVAKITALYKQEFHTKKPKLKLPDALIAATCKFHNATLVTENPSDFPMTDIKKITL